MPAKDLEKVVVSRAGIKGRSYSCTVYRIQPNQRKKAIFVMIEMPSILYTLYEMNTFGQHNSSTSAPSSAVRASANDHFSFSHRTEHAGTPQTGA